MAAPRAASTGHNRLASNAIWLAGTVFPFTQATTTSFFSMGASRAQPHSLPAVHRAPSLFPQLHSGMQKPEPTVLIPVHVATRAGTPWPAAPWLGSLDRHYTNLQYDMEGVH